MSVPDVSLHFWVNVWWESLRSPASMKELVCWYRRANKGLRRQRLTATLDLYIRAHGKFGKTHVRRRHSEAKAQAPTRVVLDPEDAEYATLFAR